MAEATVNQQMLTGPEGHGMAAVAPRQINPIDAVAQSRAVRHFGKLIGLAAAVAIGMVVVLWTAEPNYSPLFANMAGKDAAQVADALMSRDIDFKLDATDGTLLVDQTRLSEARLLLASQGLNDGADQGLEMLQQDQGLGTSQFIENARYNHALEAELVRSVESIRAVEKARVHLAIPEQSIFIRNRTRPSASVVVKLHPGRVLNAGQVEAIVQMIASSIPMLESSEVKVVNQFGRLLTDEKDEGMALTTRQFDYTRKLEDNFADRIINLLQPIIGEGKVNAQVAAQLDFSAVESTREAYDPERSVVRSEQFSEEASSGFSQALGIPGALSNRPPGTGRLGAEVESETEVDAETDRGEAISGVQNRSSTRNFEVDRVISHTNNPVGSVQRLSVAVIIDDKLVTADDGSITRIPYSDEEIARFDKLVKETIGFDANRGDSVSIVSASFLEVEAPVADPVPAWQSLLNEAWIVNLIKQVLGALGLIAVYFIFVRPALRSLSLKSSDSESAGSTAEAGVAGVQTLGAPTPIQTGMPGQQYAGIPNLADDPNNQAAMVRRKDATYEQKVDMARSMVMDDPARVANVMKHWVGDE
jgi:flagellar M-ring protein FliF